MEADDFLATVAARLGRGRHSSPPPVPALPADGLEGRGIAPLLERFERELELVGGKVCLATSLSEVAGALEAELARYGARRLVSWAPAALSGWGVAELLASRSCASYAGDTVADREAFQTQCLHADAGIAGVDFAIASSGTLAISSGADRPRQVSLLPTLHVALVRASQIVASLAQAFEGYRRSGDLLASNVCFVTGPSRTSDIENDLSIGVHGPAAVSVIVWRDMPRIGGAT